MVATTGDRCAPGVVLLGADRASIEGRSVGQPKDVIGVSVSFTRQYAQRDELNTLQCATDPIDRLLAGERLLSSITAERNRALVAACAEYGRGEVAQRLGISRQAVYKRLQSSSVGEMVGSPEPPPAPSRIRSVMSTSVPAPMEGEQHTDRSAANAAAASGSESAGQPELGGQPELVGDDPSQIPPASRTIDSQPATPAAAQ